jgi:signal transduction histidine kinase
VSTVTCDFTRGIPVKVLIVEDNASDAELMVRELQRGGYDVAARIVQTPQEFRHQLQAGSVDLVLSDYELGGWRGMDALDIMRDMSSDIPFILVSGAVGDVAAVECIKRGVTDYVLKDSLARLPSSVRRALEEQALKISKKRAEDEIVRSNHDLEQFAHVASHDLQEPLRMVATYTQLLSERYRGKLDEQADKYIHYAVDGALRMQTLIRDLIAFSHAGSQGADLVSTDSKTAFMSAVTSLAGAVQESQARISTGDLPMVMANASQLRQVFQNLIANAIRFRGNEPPVVELSAEQKGSNWIFAISDNGIGIPPEHADTIFIVFQRLHTREEYPGTGIGLAICKRIVERHGGTIWSEARPEGGTIFKFILRGVESENVDS